MKNLIFVKPKNATDIIRDPYTGKRLLPEGQLVPETRYWRERIDSGILEERVKSVDEFAQELVSQVAKELDIPEELISEDVPRKSRKR